MIKPKISVIIPIFNTGRYLEETLNSLLSQTIINDIEVLMIDDGSDDESKYIIEKYALDYDNFHAFHKSNEGQGIARNFGVNLAKGEYIHFIDSDDYIVPDAYEKLYELVENRDYDFVVFNSLRFERYNSWKEWLFKHSFAGLNENAEFSSINEHPAFVWDSSAINKLYRKEFLEKKNIKFPNEKVFFEDLLFAFESYIKSDSFYFFNEYIYYWRVRDNGSSVTQQNESIKNFKDRIHILHLIKELIKSSNLNSNTVAKLNEKWLIHDLKVYIERLKFYSSSQYDEILDDILDFVKEISQEIKDGLNSYNKVIYKMVENRDINALLYFMELDETLRNNPDFELDLNEEYANLINFKQDVLDENLYAVKTQFDNDDENIYITFDWYLNYFSFGDSYELEAILVDEKNEECSLEISDNQIILPFDLLKTKKRISIKIKGHFEFGCRECYLETYKRGSILHDDFDFEIAIGSKKRFYINVREINREEVIIDDVSFEGDNFLFSGTSEFDFRSVLMENVITFEQIEYPVIFQGNDFTFMIPYSDILNATIKKWEIKSDYLIKLSQTFEFFKEYDKLKFFNLRNIVLVEDDIYDKYMLLNELNQNLKICNEKNQELSRDNSILKEKNSILKEKNTRLRKKKDKLKDKNSRLKDKRDKLKDKNSKLKAKNSKLKEKNAKLTEKNKDLQNLVEEYKSRKIVKVADKFKG